MRRFETARPYVVHGDEAPAFWAIGNLWRVMATGVQTDNQFCLIDQVCTDDGGGPPSHTHTQEEGLYVISGHCSFHAGGVDISAGTGTFVSVPRLTPHAFTVDAPGTQLLNFYLPAGFELLLMGLATAAERNAAPTGKPAMPNRRLVERMSADYGEAAVLGLPFADMPTPETMRTTPGPDAVVPPFAVTADQAPTYWHAGGRWSVLATGEQTAGTYCMFEQLMPNGPAAPPHLHADMDEVFYVLEGDATVLMGDRLVAVRQGGLVFIPRGTVHGFRVDSPVARLLNLYTHAGFERSVALLGGVATAPGLPPAGWTPPDMPQERRETLFEEIGMRVLAVADPFRTG